MRVNKLELGGGGGVHFWPRAQIHPFIIPWHDWQSNLYQKVNILKDNTEVYCITRAFPHHSYRTGVHSIILKPMYWLHFVPNCSLCLHVVFTEVQILIQIKLLGSIMFHIVLLIVTKLCVKVHEKNRMNSLIFIWIMDIPASITRFPLKCRYVCSWTLVLFRKLLEVRCSMDAVYFMVLQGCTFRYHDCLHRWFN